MQSWKLNLDIFFFSYLIAFKDSFLPLASLSLLYGHLLSCEVTSFCFNTWAYLFFLFKKVALRMLRLILKWVLGTVAVILIIQREKKWWCKVKLIIVGARRREQFPMTMVSLILCSLGLWRTFLMKIFLRTRFAFLLHFHPHFAAFWIIFLEYLFLRDVKIWPC